ncbi:M23 family metallopeptidase [Geminicoccus roseus]|uniref:M23 family metallopeptidase n=1 Tax=Geminicoccus roseus TaxID=404900 RepID=UPI00041F4D9D|nr:M23 family metallopeptidase [Geminicoccus roseus]
MVRRVALPLLVIAAGLAGCSELRPVEQGVGQSWVTAKRAAYTGPARLHKVVRGDTASGIADRYGVSLQSFVVANNLSKPYIVKLGSNVRIPPKRGESAPRAVPAQAPRPVEREAPAQPSPMAPQPAPSDIQVATLAPLPSVREAPVPAPAPEPAAAPVQAVPDPGAQARASAKTPPPLSGDGFLWPASGSVVSGFGKKIDGSENDGINIAAAPGTPVLAAENGVVSYASDEIVGWGKMVLIRHADGFTTGYAHLETILTAVGDDVARGQVIGRVGQTGYVETPQLHFELRSGKRALNPSKHLIRDKDLEVASR